MDFTNWASTLEQSLKNSASTFSEFLPKLIGALILVVLGYLLAKLVSYATVRLLGLMGLDRLLGRTAIQTILERSGTKKSAPEIIGLAGFWIIFLLFLISATETLGLSTLSQALTGVAYYFPKIAIALLIIILGLLAANFVRELIHLACTSAGIPQGPILAQAFYVAAILLIVVTAVNQLGIDTTLLNSTLIILVAGIIAGAALSFGLGAKTAVANLIAAHYLEPVFKIGQHVRAGEIHGEIVAISPIAIIIETGEGRVVLPASHFIEQASVITHTKP